jgi:hypothetical protein
MAESKTIQVPRLLFREMVAAIRAAAKDSRRDRVLHDETVAMLDPVDEAVRDFLDSRLKVT